MDVSFSERLANVMALQKLLDRGGANGHGDARQLEDSAYRKASSKV
jgi:hypothetical protein